MKKGCVLLRGGSVYRGNRVKGEKCVHGLGGSVFGNGGQCVLLKGCRVKGGSVRRKGDIA